MDGKKIFWALSCSLSLFTMSCSSSQYLVNSALSTFNEVNKESTTTVEKVKFAKVTIKIPGSKNSENKFSTKSSSASSNYFYQTEITEMELQVQPVGKSSQPLSFFQSYTTGNPIVFNVDVPYGLNNFILYAKDENGTIVDSLSGTFEVSADNTTFNIDVITTLEQQVINEYAKISTTPIKDRSKIRDFILYHTDYDPDNGHFYEVDPKIFNAKGLAEEIKKLNGNVPDENTPITEILNGSGTVDFTCTESGVTIWTTDLNGEKHSIFGTSGTLNNLTPGVWTISVSKPGFQTQNIKVEIKEGETTTLSVTLLPSDLISSGTSGDVTLTGGSGNTNVNVSSQGGLVKVAWNNEYRTFDESTLDYLFIGLASGNDTVNVQKGVNTPITVDAGDGVNLFTSNNFDETVYYGGSGNDYINLYNSNITSVTLGIVQPVTLFGGAGNDTINTYQSTDIDSLYIDGGSGNDYINLYNTNITSITVGLMQPAVIIGGTGDDKINAYYQNIDNQSLFADGEDGNDYINVFNSNTTSFTMPILPVTLFGGTGNDTLIGSNVNDYLIGGSENDLIKGNNGNDILNGDDGNDTIYYDSRYDTASGGAGTNTLIDLSGLPSPVTLTGGVLSISGTSGNDSLDFYLYPAFSSGSVYINGQNYEFDASSVTSVNINMGEGNDTLFGYSNTTTPITISGGLGNDYVWAGVLENGGTTTFLGGDGDDIFYGSTSPTLAGNSILKGEGGNDNLNAYKGNASLYGGDGTDYLIGHDDLSKNVLLDGSAGQDTLVSSNNNTNLQGVDTLIGNTTYKGANGNDYIQAKTLP